MRLAFSEMRLTFGKNAAYILKYASRKREKARRKMEKKSCFFISFSIFIPKFPLVLTVFERFLKNSDNKFSFPSGAYLSENATINQKLKRISTPKRTGRPRCENPRFMLSK